MVQKAGCPSQEVGQGQSQVMTGEVSGQQSDREQPGQAGAEDRGDQEKYEILRLSDVFAHLDNNIDEGWQIW